MRVVLFAAAHLTIAMLLPAVTKTCKLPSESEKAKALFEQVDDGPWKAVSRPSQELAGDVISLASVYEFGGRTHVKIYTWIAGDIEEVALYCFGANHLVEALKFEAITAWGWSYRRVITCDAGRRKSREEFFDSRTKSQLKTVVEEIWIREHVREYESLKDLPFYHSLRTGKR